MLHRHRQCLQSIRRRNDTTIAIGLLLVGIILFDESMVKALQLLIPLYRTEVGGLEYGRCHCNRML